VLLGVPQIINGGRFFDKAGNRVAAGASAGQQQAYNGNSARVLYEYESDKY
jgi:hypothetical protein